jgi:hypothetical protein
MMRYEKVFCFLVDHSITSPIDLPSDHPLPLSSASTSELSVN